MVTGRILKTRHLRIAVGDIRAASPVDGKRGAVEIQFDEAERSRLTRLAMFGQPGAAPDRVILNVDEPEIWLTELKRRIEATRQGSRQQGSTWMAEGTGP